MGKEVNIINKMVDENIKLIYKPTATFYFSNDMIKKKYEFEELLSVATISLYKAAEKFDKTKGYEFSTYAIPLIRYGLLEFTRNDKWYYRRTNIQGIEKYEPIDRISTSIPFKEVGDNCNKEITLEDSLQEQEDFYKNVEDKYIIENLLKTCTERERKILIGYFFEDKSQVALSKEFKTSQSFISLVIRRNLKKFKKIMEEEEIDYVR